MITINTRTVADKKKFISWYLQTNSMIDDKYNVSLCHYDISIHGGIPAIAKEFEFTVGAHREPPSRRIIFIESYNISEQGFILEKCCGHFYKSSTAPLATITTRDCKTYAVGMPLPDNDMRVSIVGLVFQYEQLANKGFMYGLESKRAPIDATVFSVVDCYQELESTLSEEWFRQAKTERLVVIILDRDNVLNNFKEIL